ncbi:carboxy-S-adenosyl-L-methionine synthase CmoA [Motiliproteus coralliicola]|uniref:Carboxy-S-adenosyl-L-methionine synthase n=1 Tax=Motiliproteus coralliicola TaxID=2283196 RepID=A0A369WTB0_9GAMM|nr:carboxy-S-adenosyl-L-methionine synthase CmoA [Motiliproteus coralliicola]RDE22735.1 carboxy-S-adenosyl-L-methionine synthase CmoA [Motiliproteus coralliicola]
MAKDSDQLYAQPLNQIVDFQFDEQVVGVFADMINRSVPGYATVVKSLGILAARYAQPDSNLYDLGCSLGAATLSMQQQVRQPNCRFIAIDNSPAMIERCREHLQVAAMLEEAEPRTELVCADINTIEIRNASVVVMNFTLQFIEPDQRFDLLQRIYDGLKPGGVLLLSEKIAFEDDAIQQRLTDWHHDFKRANGYSDLEISQKRSALEKVMRPESLSLHQQRLGQIGFSCVQPWFQCFNFASMLAIK